jgi:Rrf2 family protein
MYHLAEQHYADEPLRIREIADAYGIPQRFLVQILLQLKAAGLTASTRGAAGGYRLARPPEEISLGEIMSAIDGQEEEIQMLTHRTAASDVLQDAWREAAEVQRQVLSAVSLADLLDSAVKRTQNMYYI